MSLSSWTVQAGSEISEGYIDEAFDTVAADVGVPVKLLRAICWSESRLNPEAYNFGDGSGMNHAFGICQVLHTTAKSFGFKDDNCYKDFSSTSHTYRDCKLFGVQTNIKYAALYLRSKLEKYDNSWISGIAAYNTGILRSCKKGLVHRLKDNKVIYTCKVGGLLNQKYVDRVLEAMEGNK